MGTVSLGTAASFLLALAFLAAAHAGDLGPLVTAEPVPWREGVIQLGDSETQVRRVAGRPPDRAVPLYLNEHFPVGEQWMFIGGPDNPQLLWVELIRGRVTRVWIEPKQERDRR